MSRDDPKPGELWTLRDDDSPWPHHQRCPTVKILDVMGEWVLYRHAQVFLDERMKLEMFVQCYQKATD